MATKRDLGVSYLLGAGLGLIATLTWFSHLTKDFKPGLIVATVTAGILSGTFVFIGYWMYHSKTTGETAWIVAKWSSIGLSIPVAFGATIFWLNPPSMFQSLVPGIFINLVAVGGVVGLLLGLVLELRREQADLRQLNERNKVLNRVLRHNIRNDMNVMQLYVDQIEAEEGATGNVEDSIEALHRKIEEVVATSNTARRIDDLHVGSIHDGPVDVVELIKDRIDIVCRTHSNVDVSLDIPEEVEAAVGPIFESVIDNIVENAMEHTDGTPSLDVVVEPSDATGGPVRMILTDDGPGIPDSEVRLIERGEQSQLQHGTGLGLWLVKWVVEYFGGTVQIDTPATGGTRIVVEVPPASTPNERSTGWGALAR